MSPSKAYKSSITESKGTEVSEGKRIKKYTFRNDQ
jgi:hypothetical protein